jgi:hypothetical protein
MNLAGRQVLEPCSRRVGEVQRQIGDDDLVGGGSAQLACQAVVVEPYTGVRLPRVLVNRRGLAEALREAHSADLPAEYTGSRGFRRRRAILSVDIAPAPSGVVACCRPCLGVACPPRIDDVASVTILGLPTCVKDPLPDRRAPWLEGRSAAPPACTDASGPCAPPSSRALPCWRMRDAELSSSCTGACSMSACASRCRFRASSVEGASMAHSSVAAMMRF